MWSDKGGEKMLREWIVDNFFTDIVAERSLETNKCLRKQFNQIQERLNNIQRPTNERIIDSLRGRIFSQIEYEEILNIVKYGRRE